MSQKHLNSSSVCWICRWHWTIILQHGEHRGMPYTCSDVFVISLQGLSWILFSVYESNWSISVWHHISSSFYFMPTQLYVDLQLMIKNVFFCAAKDKVQDPNNNMYIILLRMDQLETSFGILYTMVGNDTNADALQLSTRLSHVSKIQNILAAHLAWDCSPHQLKLPSWDEVEMKSQHMDHVTLLYGRGMSL